MKRSLIVATILASLILSGCAKDVPSIPVSADTQPQSEGTTAAPSTVVIAVDETTSVITAEPVPQAEDTPLYETSQESSTEQSQNGIVVKDGITYVNGILIANKTYSLPSDYNPGIIPDAQDAFDEMQSAAAAEGLNIYISSGFRSYSYQDGLYNRYVERSGKVEADRYSARAGHSEHQTGLAFDLNTIDDSFADTAEGKWVAKNCYKYGFIIRYPKGMESVTGYIYEPWHIRYLGKETAKSVYDSGLTLEEYLDITSEYGE